MELTIGKEISKYRKIKGYTQEQLGEIIGVSGQAVSKWENGGVPDTYLLPKIASTLGVSIDALFCTEKKVSEWSTEEILDNIFKFCSYNYCYRTTNTFDPFKFLFEAIWSIQCAYLENKIRPDLMETVNKNIGNPQLTSQLIKNDGTTYLTLIKDFPFFCAVWDTPEISRKILSETNFSEFFSLLASPDGFKAVIFTQTATETSQYTTETIAKKMGISVNKFLEIEPLLIKYRLLKEDTLTLDDQIIKIYHKWSNPEIRPILIMSYQFINARQCYYNFVCNRAKPYFEYE